MNTNNLDLISIIENRYFAQIETLLRRGTHISKAHGDLYNFIQASYEVLDDYFSALNCDLVWKDSTYFYLSPHGDGLNSNPLKPNSLLLGLILADFLLSENCNTSSVSCNEIIDLLHSKFGKPVLNNFIDARQKNKNESEAKREGVLNSLHELTLLGFIAKQNEDAYSSLPPLARFADIINDSGGDSFFTSLVLKNGKFRRIESPDEENKKLRNHGLIDENEEPIPFSKLTDEEE